MELTKKIFLNAICVEWQLIYVTTVIFLDNWCYLLLDFQSHVV